MRTKKPSALFIRKYLIYFMAVLLLPIPVMVLIYFRLSDIVTYNAYQQTLASLKNSSAIIHENIESLKSLSYNISQNSLTSRFFLLNRFDRDQTIISDIYQTQKALLPMTVANNIINSIQLYSSVNDTIIDAQTSAISSNRYYGTVFSVDGYDYERWRDEYLNKPYQSAILPARSTYVNRSTKRRVAFIQSVPLGAKTHYSGSIVILIDEDALIQMFSSIPYQNGGFLYVLDQQGEYIMKDYPPSQVFSADLIPDADALQEGYSLMDIGGVQQLVICYSDGQWRYISAVPHALVIESANASRHVIIAMIIITICAGCILALFYAYKTSQPMISIYGQLTSSGSVPPNELGNEIAALVKKNDNLKDIVDQQLPAQRTALLYGLLSGGFSDKKTLIYDFSKLDIDLKEGAYLVLVAVLTDLDSTLSFSEISIYKELVKELLWAGIPGVIGACDMDFEHIVLLSALPNPDDPQQRELLSAKASELSTHAREDVGISLSFSAAIADQLTDIPAAFLVVQSTIRVSAFGEHHHIHWCDETDIPTVFYPESLAAQLLSAVKAGRTSLFFELWGSIKHRNAACLTDAPSEPGYQLLQMLYTTLLKADVGQPTEGESFLDNHQSIATAISQREMPPATLFEQLQDAFFDKTIRNAENTVSRDALLVRVLEHVDANYCDPQISLTSVADLFHINEVYLSRVFKQSTGENFSRYIETQRLQHANELIADGRHKISEISQLVGYNSPQVFRRAYKRCYGTSPSKNQAAPDDA